MFNAILKFFNPQLIIFLMVVLFTGCLFEEADEPIQQIDEINFKTDKEYIYRWILSENNGDGFKVVDAERFSLQVVDTNATLKGEDSLTVLKSAALGSNKSNFAKTWYRKTGNKFTAIAFSRSGLNPNILPKRKSTPSDPAYLLFPRSVALAMNNGLDSVANRTPFTIRQADTTMRIEPRIVYKFPFLEEMNWISFEEPFLQTRKVEERLFTSVDAGTFATFKVVTNSDFFRDSFMWHDFVAEQGLIKREISFTTRPFDQDNNPLPEKVTMERVELVEIRPL